MLGYSFLPCFLSHACDGCLSLCLWALSCNRGPKAEKLMPETEHLLDLSCLSPRVKPRSPDGGLTSGAKPSQVHPKDGGPCGAGALKSPGGSTSPRAGLPPPASFLKTCPTSDDSTQVRQNFRVWGRWEVGQGRVKGNRERRLSRRPRCPLSTHGSDPVLPHCGHFW